MSKVNRYELRVVQRYSADGEGDIETEASMKLEPKGRYMLFEDRVRELAAAEGTVPVSRELLQDAVDELAHMDHERLADDKMGLRTTPPRVARLLSKLRDLLEQQGKGVT